MALRHIKVVEFGGLAPAPFCGMILADHGAKVIRIDKPKDIQSQGFDRGKRSIVIDLKKPAGLKVAWNLCKSADVIIEPFRPGVMEKLKMGPNDLAKVNPGLVYARLTGFGQSGSYAPRAGHDLNYLAVSGVLSQFGRHKERPHWPINLMADFAGGGLMCAFGIVTALLERGLSGKGQVVDTAMVEGAAYIGTWLWSTKHTYMWQGERGNRLLDGGPHFYEVYATKDNKYMSVGSLEPQFYHRLLKGLGIKDEDMGQLPVEEWSQNKEKIGKLFAAKTQAEWCQVFDGEDACVMPVLSLEEATQHPHNQARQAFISGPAGEPEPAPVPKLSRTPGCTTPSPAPLSGQNSIEILREFNYSESDIKELTSSGAVVQKNVEAKL